MGSEVIHPADGVIDAHILALLQYHQRLTFLALAEAFPTHTWRSLFAALSRLRVQRRVELLPLATDYEVVWRPEREKQPPVSEVSYQRV
jgi:hypothetical protein